MHPEDVRELPMDVVLRVTALLDPRVARLVSRGVRDALDATEVTELDLRWRGPPRAQGPPAAQLKTIRGLLSAGRVSRLSRVSLDELGAHAQRGCRLADGLLDALPSRGPRCRLLQLSIRLINRLARPPEPLGAVLRAHAGSLERLDVPEVFLTGKEDGRRLEDDLLRGLRSLPLLRSLAVGVGGLSALPPLVEALVGSGAAGRLERLELDLPVVLPDRSAHLLNDALSSMPSLRILAIRSMWLPSPPSGAYTLTALARLTALNSLDLEGAQLGPFFAGGHPTTPPLTALRSLRVRRLCDPPDSVPVEVLSALSGLTRLELRDDVGWLSPPTPLPATQCDPAALLPNLAVLRSGRLAATLLAHPGSLPSLTHLSYFSNSLCRTVQELLPRRLPTMPKLASLALMRSRDHTACVPHLGLPRELPGGITRLVAGWPQVATSRTSWWQALLAPALSPSGLVHLEIYFDTDLWPVTSTPFRGLPSLTSLNITVASTVRLPAASYATLGESLRHLGRLAELELEFNTSSLDGLRGFLRAAGAHAAAGRPVRRVVLTKARLHSETLLWSDYALADTSSLAEECRRAFPAARAEFRTTRGSTVRY